MVDSALGSVAVGDPVQTQAIAQVTLTGHVLADASVAIQSAAFGVGSTQTNASALISSALGTNVTWTASLTLPANASMNGSSIVLAITVAVQGVSYSLMSAPFTFNYYTTFEGTHLTLNIYYFSFKI